MSDLVQRLLAHYRAHRRQLPWRETRDPYAIWVSEIMLQQTRVATVIPYYQRWLERFPDVRALADAPLDDVLERWSGLGYYRRARNLHRGAREVVERYDGALPRTARDLQTVPGIGRYTAGAIASIAFGEPAPLVDGNVARVLARIFAVELDVKSTAGQKELWRLAGELVPDDAPGDFNQALMELGATICTPTSPRCADCPVAADCAAQKTGRQDELPVLPARKRAGELPRLDRVAAWIVRDGRLLLARRLPEGLYGGLFELPQAGDADDTRALTEPGIQLTGRRAVHRHEQTLSHRRLRIRVFHGEVERSARLAGSGCYDQLLWHPMDDVDRLGISSATRAIVDHLRDRTWTNAPKPSPSSRRATKRS